MRFGIMVRPDQIQTAALAGYNYIEMNVNDILKMNEDTYISMIETMDAHSIRAEVLYGILPDNVPIIGDHVSSQAISAAMEQTLEIAQLLGADTLIFDCPALRRIPYGFDLAMAWRQTGNFIRRLQGWAASANINIALMPLQRNACGILRHLSEAAMIPSLLLLDRIGIAASLYNMSMEAESAYELRSVRSRLMHMRVSNTLGDLPPRKGDGMDYERILHILRDSGYDGRVTIEGTFTDFNNQAYSALEAVRESAVSLGIISNISE